MGMKGQIKPDHIPLNKAQLVVLGLPPLTFIEIDGLEKELEVVDLPDRTKASGGQTKAIQFMVKLPMHHTVEQAAMQLWFQQSQDPVLPTYKKPATLILPSISGVNVKSYTLVGCFPSKEKLPGFKMEDEGKMADNEWTINADDMIPV